MDFSFFMLCVCGLVLCVFFLSGSIPLPTNQREYRDLCLGLQAFDQPVAGEIARSAFLAASHESWGAATGSPKEIG